MTKIHSTAKVHPTAVVAEGAVIGEGSTVGPYAVIGPDAVIGRGNIIASHVVIEGHTTIGNENHIFQFASIGAAPQDLKYGGEDTILEIGDGNIIREYVTLQPGTSSGHARTVIGSHNMFMACSHVGHDGEIGSYNVFANSCALAGHVSIGSRVIIGGLCGVHQFVRVGDLAMLGAGCMVTKDIPPFCIAQGDRAGLVGINKIGLERNGFSPARVQLLRRLYREMFSGNHTLIQRLAGARENYGKDEGALAFIEFIEKSERGVTFPRRRGKGSE